MGLDAVPAILTALAESSMPDCAAFGPAPASALSLAGDAASAAAVAPVTPVRPPPAAAASAGWQAESLPGSSFADWADFLLAEYGLRPDQSPAESEYLTHRHSRSLTVCDL